MIQGTSEKKLFFAWAAFFGLMIVPSLMAIGVWTEIVEDEDLQGILVLLFLAVTSYFSFRLIVTKIMGNSLKNDEKICGKEGSNMFCSNCGAKISDRAIVCVNCGVALKSDYSVANVSNEWLTALLLCFFLGGLGIHRFYTKNNDIAVAQLMLGVLSCGVISGIWALIDFILILSGTYKKGDGQKLNSN